MRVRADQKSAGEANRESQVSEANNTIVVKFGSSVLKDQARLEGVVTEIYRYTRAGVRVVAVVSAFEGDTDRLFSEAEKFGSSTNSRHLPRLVMTGEEKAASMLALACDQTGLNVRIVSAREIDLIAEGETGDAHPQSVDETLLRKVLAEFEAVIVPGFIGTNVSGEPVLFGRGGSDLTAVFLAKALGLDSVTFIKDVDGVFDRDPALTDGKEAKKYKTVSWEDAKGVSTQLLQPKAVLLAEAAELPIKVARLNSVQGTVVARETKRLTTSVTYSPIRIGIAGLGVVGGGLAHRLTREEEGRFTFTNALVKDRSKKRDFKVTQSSIHDDIDSFLNDECEIVVDALSCGETGAKLTRHALERGIDVVSANKQALAGDLSNLHCLASDNNASLLYSAAVGGGTPMIETVSQALNRGPIESIEAIVNGTVNFILSAMNGGLKFAEAVKAAQEVGFAEADPTADLSGLDAKAKASILSYEAWGIEPKDSDFSAQALDESFASSLLSKRGEWRQLTRISRDGQGDVLASVTFEDISDVTLFRQAENEANALRAITVCGEVLNCQGRGAGRVATVESVLADLGVLLRRKI